ncbi:MAG: enoyl-CoA hydratase-related protein [Pseudomonadota bacterium]
MSAVAGVERFSVGPLVQLVINNPTNQNAMSLAMWEALEKHIESVSRDSDVQVLVITGAGVRDFCSGHFDYAETTSEPRIAFDSAVARTYVALRALQKPTVARIQGNCLDAGFELAQACDVRIAVESAKFAMSPAKFGVGQRINEVEALADRIGLSLAKDILFYGKRFDAKVAEEMGFVSAVTTAGGLDTMVERHAVDLIGNLTMTAALLKRAFAEVFGGGAAKQE